MFQYTRWVRLPRASAPGADERHAWRQAINVVLLSLCVASAAIALYAMPARAAEEVVDGVGDTDFAGEGGMPASNPRVAGILAAHPNQFVVVCVAGCDGKPKAVDVLPKPEVQRKGSAVPSSADMSKSAYGPPAPGSAAAKDADDVVCLAGCSGRTPQVLQRFADLPVVKRQVPKKTDQEPDAKPKMKPKSDDSIWDDLIP